MDESNSNYSGANVLSSSAEGIMNVGLSAGAGALEFSSEPSIDSVDFESVLIGMDDHTAPTNRDGTNTPLDEVWDAPSSPQPEPATPNTSSVDETPVGPDEKNESEEIDHAVQPSKYHLRPQTRELKGFTRTWIDRDDSGNYGEKVPNDELRKARRRQNHVKFQLRPESDPKYDETDGGGVNDQNERRAIPTLLISLAFKSEDGKAKYKSIIKSRPKEIKYQYDDENYNGYRLRKRGSSASTGYYSECNLDKSQFDPELPNDLTGHPVARGCWECLGLGIRCPLLDDERAWPCTTCIEDEHVCNLVTPPRFKRACERCKLRRRSCSYIYAQKHGEACQECMDNGHRCVAGPVKDKITTRIRYERDWKKDPPAKERPFKVRKAHSLDDSAQQPTLPNSTTTQRESAADNIDKGMAELDEDPFVRDRVPSRNNHHVKKTKFEHEAHGDTRPSKIHKVKKHSSGKTYKIQTRFCHPIIFNHEDVGTETTCHFCSDPSYAVFGLASRDVEVIEWQDGRGLEEICGGHKGEGVENTRVCITCTTERLPIIMCRTHELQPLKSTENDKFDENDAFAELLSGDGILRGRWCSICANLAMYECGTPGDDGAGCGLLVCEHCTLLLVGMYDGDLQKMLPEMSDEPTKERMLGLRADHEFLKEDGLLMKYVLWNSER